MSRQQAVLKVNIDYEIGDIVYLKMASTKRAGMVTSIWVRLSDCCYYVSWGDGTDTTHYPIELTDTYLPDFKSDD